VAAGACVLYINVVCAKVVDGYGNVVGVKWSEL
jgi:hypothetical protein